MLKFWKKKQDELQASDANESDESGSSNAITWSKEALQALEQSVSQSPVPKLMKNQVKKQLKKAAEKVTAAAGRSEVTPEDMMQGLLDKLPADMRRQVEQAAKQGPAGLKHLQKRLSKK